MRTLLTRRPLATMAVLVAATACADMSAPSAPVAADADVPALAASARPGGGTGGSPTYVATGKVLRRTAWENRDVTASAYVTPERGGRLEIRSAGLRVHVPEGAVGQATWVTATAFAGNKVVYEFGPHGTQFLVPILIEQDLRETNAFDDDALARDLFGGYAPAGLSDVDSDGTVSVSETFPVDLQPDTERVARWARFYTTHFSGYVLASGKTDTTKSK